MTLVKCNKFYAKCSICNKTFKTPKRWNNHLKSKTHLKKLRKSKNMSFSINAFEKKVFTNI